MLKDLRVDPKTLPAPLNTIIKGKTVNVHTDDSVVNLKTYPNDGERGYIRVIDINANVDNTLRGSWSGSNMNSHTKADDEGLTLDIQPGCFVLVGYEGGMRGKGIVWTSVYMNELDVPEQKDTSDLSLSPNETKALYLIRQYNSKGRTECFPRNGLGVYGKENPIIVSLAEKGMLKIVGNGVSVLPAGHNHNIPRMSCY